MRRRSVCELSTPQNPPQIDPWPQGSPKEPGGGPGEGKGGALRPPHPPKVGLRPPMGIPMGILKIGSPESAYPSNTELFL